MTANCAQTRLVDLPEVTLDAVHQHHRDLLRVAVAQFVIGVQLPLRPRKSQPGSHPSDGVARRSAQVAVSFGEENDVGVCHASTVSPLTAAGDAAAVRCVVLH